MQMPQPTGQVAARGGVATVTNNLQPVAVDDILTLRNSANISIDVLLNDSDVDGDTLSLTSANAQFGEVSLIDNQLHYTPVQQLIGRDTVTYGISDGNGGSASATLTIELVSNSLPVAANDTAIVEAGKSVIIDVLANDSDADGDSLGVIAASADKGTVSIGSDNRLNFQAGSSDAGTVLITYRVTDGYGGSVEGIVTVTVSAAAATTPPPAPSPSNPGRLRRWRLHALVWAFDTWVGWHWSSSRSGVTA